jgi:serine/threonine protein kinase
MEYADGEELFETIQRSGEGIEERAALSIFKQLCLGLSFIHSCGIAHMDISPENTIVSFNHNNDPHIKICDYGLSLMVDTIADTIKLECPRGKVAYMAPEIASPHLQQGKGEELYDARCADMYSAGITLFVTLFGFQAYQLPSRSRDERFDVLCSHGIRKLVGCYDKIGRVSDTTMSLLESLLCCHDKRATVLQTLNHPALQNLDRLDRLDIDMLDLAERR